jgi:hypothetical protein
MERTDKLHPRSEKVFFLKKNNVDTLDSLAVGA